MELGLHGKTAVVTGGAKGMGYEIAGALLREGCNVMIAEIDEKSLEEATGSLTVFGACSGFLCDVSCEEQVEAMMKEAEHIFGRVDILVNNAGVLRPKPIEAMTEKDWDFSINVNLKSAFLCSKHAFIRMKRQQGGVILNASSFSAVMPSVQHGAYAAAKTAVISLTKTCAAEFAPYNVRVLGYIPGVIATHLTAAMRADKAKAAELKSDIALNRFGNPAEVAQVVAFLASERASYMTGTMVEIHGGKFCVQDPGEAYI